MTKCVYRDLWHHCLSCAMLPYRATRYIMNSPSPPNTAHETDSQATLRGSSRNRMWRSVVVGMATVVVSIITIVMAAESGKRDTDSFSYVKHHSFTVLCTCIIVFPLKWCLSMDKTRQVIVVYISVDGQ